jgi:hypothetical protein
MSVYSCTMNSWYGSLYVHDCRLCALLIVIIIEVWCTFGYGTIMFFFFFWFAGQHFGHVFVCLHAG